MNMNETTKDLDKQMTELAQGLPVEAVRKMEKVLKRLYSERDLEYNKTSLVASLVILQLTIPTLPQMYAEMMQASMLILYRLIHEQDTGLVESPIKL